jgi:hypothetical protein
MRSFSNRVVGALLSGAALTVASPAEAQDEMGPPDVEFEEGFGLIQGIRELSDGRVLVADRAGKLVGFVDFDAGSLRVLGQVGRGPDEYDLPSSLVALPNDHSMLLDLGNMRLVDIDSEGTFGKTYQARRNTDHSTTTVSPRGSDQDGWLYFEPRSPGPGPETGYVLRWHPETDLIEEVASFQRAPVDQSSRRGPPPPFALNDTWNVLADGSLVIARALDYGVDWVRDGESTSGPVIMYEPVRVTDADTEAFRERFAQTALAMDVNSDGSVGGAFSPGREMVDQAYPDKSFPAVKGPFVDGGVQVAPWGEAWVRRSEKAGAPAVYDIFDQNGERIRQVRLEAESRLVGFGPTHIYTVRTDQFGLEYLRRHSR